MTAARRLLALLAEVLPVDPEANRVVEAYAAERERRQPLERRPIAWQRASKGTS